MSARFPSVTERPSQNPAAPITQHSILVCLRLYLAVALCFSFAALVFGCKFSLIQPKDGVRCRTAVAEIAARDTTTANPSGNEKHVWCESTDYADLVNTGDHLLRELLAIGSLAECGRQRWSPRSPPWGSVLIR